MVLAALMLDRLLAEPARCHPLVAFGRWAAWLEVRLNSPHPARSRLAGWLAMLLALTPWCVVVLLMYLAAAQLWLWLILNVLVLYSCIGWQSLQRHVVAVASASDSEQARARLGLIVSRDTQSLSDDEIAQSACESLLENSTDALFASLFWFALGGAPAALLHRWVNTLDAMWGYRNPRFRFFGTPVARLDDLMAFWPARISAGLFILVTPRRWLQAVRCWRRQARQCASPNGGVVMTTGAGALNIRLSERACYHGQWKSKPPMGCGPGAGMKDIPRAVSLVSRSLWLFMGIWLLAAAVAYSVS